MDCSASGGIHVVGFVTCHAKETVLPHSKVSTHPKCFLQCSCKFDGPELVISVVN